ncbi:MAG: hypothetical protein R3C39_05610 [Dehalococcoidia bacterium]
MESAEQAIEQQCAAINERDVPRYLASTNFPFTYQNYNGVSVTVESADRYPATAPWPWDIILSTDPRWSRTVYDTVEEVARSESSAALKRVFRRITDDGGASEPYQAIWIATRVDGQWGVQLRHNLGSR